MRFAVIVFVLIALAALGAFAYLVSASEQLEPRVEEQRVPVDF